MRPTFPSLSPKYLKQEERSLRWAKWLEAFIVLLTLSLIGGAYFWDKTERRALSQRQMDQAHWVLAYSLRNAETILRTMRAAIQSHPYFDATDWSRHIQSLKPASKDNCGLAYAPFLIGPADARGRLGPFLAAEISPPGQRPEYVPILHSATFDEGAPPPFGADGWVDTERRRAMEEARDTGGITATAPSRWLENDGHEGSLGVTLFAAVYRGGGAPASLAARRESLHGFVILSMSARRLQSLLQNEIGGKTLALEDPDAPAARRTLFTPALKTSGDASFTATLPVGDRRWRLSLPAGPPPPGGARLTGWAMGTGLLIIVATAALLFGNKKTLEESFRMAQSLTQELGQSVLFLDSILQELPTVVYVKDAEKLRFVHVNPAGERLLGISRWELIGRRNHECFHPEEAAIFEEHDRAALAAQRPIETAMEVVTTRSDHRRLTRVRRVPIKDAQGHFRHLLCVVEDITEQKYYEDALKQAIADAETANRTKSAFLAQMSHELRTPLNSVIGFSNLLLKNKRGSLDNEDILRLRKIQSNGTHLLELINSILDLSRVEAGRMPVEKSAFDLSQLVTETVEQLGGGLLEEGRVVLLSEIPKEPTPIESDPGKLKQVIINLIGNAIKFTPQGSVTVRVVSAPGGAPRSLEVIDTGIGIPPDKVDRIFEAFQQVDAGTARRFGGTGLGLTVSRALVELLGYRMELESQVGKGSVFRVVFSPASAPAPVNFGG